MRKTVLVVLGLAVAAAVSLPSAYARPRATLAERLEARATCISERGVGDPIKRREFRLLYGRRPFRKCVRFQIRQMRAELRLELPMIRAECRLAQREAPIEFRQDYPGGIRQCVRLESAP
jgi:hypothetical protein